MNEARESGPRFLVVSRYARSGMTVDYRKSGTAADVVA
jgi:hypothetical protein